MNLGELVSIASDKSRFQSLGDYVEFARRFTEFAVPERLQAVIVAQAHPHYCFLQYRRDGHYNITRPLNTDLLCSPGEVEQTLQSMMGCFLPGTGRKRATPALRSAIRRGIYTIQQCIGAALDALPAGKSNNARKVNGDLFERLILLLMQAKGIDCKSGTLSVHVRVPGEQPFVMKYQHDLIVKSGDAVTMIGGVKTSTKDRLDKMFVDKFLYSRLTGTDIPHVAIVLNDVQRKGGPPQPYGISRTFLPGRFKGYTIRLNPLDGVYYCDMPNVVEDDAMLGRYIHPIDKFFLDDLKRLVDGHAQG